MSYQHRPPYPPTAPPGWGPMPFQGAAPPIPASFATAINQQQWAMGQWQVNPHYNPARFPPQNPNAPPGWVVGGSWQQMAAAQAQAQAQAANFNPFKKVIKPPSAEYLSMPLSDNPLGLHGMVEAEDRYQDDSKVPQTPWVWNPLTLSNDAEPLSRRNRPPASTASAAAASNAPARHLTEPTIPTASSTPTPTPLARHATEPAFPSAATPKPHQTTPQRPGLEARESFTADLELRPTFSPKIVRTPEYYSKRTNSTGSSRTDSIDSLSSRFEKMHPNPDSRSSSLDSNASSNPPSRHNSQHSFYSLPPSGHSSAASISGVPALSDEPGSIGSAPRGLGSSTTLHTIVEDTPRRRRSHKDSVASYDRTRSPSPFRQQDATPRPSHVQPQYQYQRPPQDVSRYYVSSDATHHPHHQHQQHTPPNTTSYDGQQHTPPESYPTPRRSSHQHYSPPDRDREPSSRRRSGSTHQTTPPEQSYHPISPAPSTSGSRSSRYYAPPAENVHPLPIPPRPNNFDVAKEREKFEAGGVYSSASAAAAAARSSGGGGGGVAPRSAPTPVPTQINFNPHAGLLPSPTSPTRPSPSRASSSTSTSASSPTDPGAPSGSGATGLGPRPIKLRYTANPVPPHLPKMTVSLRQGFWNKRGDHLTHDGYIVYAPSNMAYPPQLAEYPEVHEGYRDDFGHIAEFDPGRAELEDSLPRRGEPPRRPYVSFLVFVSRDILKPREKEPPPP